MHHISPLESVDYLVVGHLACDLTPEGSRLGGTVAYSALTASALGFRAGIVTSWGSELPLGPLSHIPIINHPSERSTTFENIYTPDGRVQTILYVAQNLDYFLVPDPWCNAPIVHLGPLAQEVEPTLVRRFPNSLIGITAQGWLRDWDGKGNVYPTEWPEAAFVLEKVGAAVISVEDVNGDDSRIEEMATYCQVLAVTEGSKGVCLYWNGDVRRFPTPEVTIVDSTGAGDIFATALFSRLYTTHDPWEAARFATQLTSYSVTRTGLEGIPTQEEIQACMVEVF